MLFYQLADVA